SQKPYEFIGGGDVSSSGGAISKPLDHVKRQPEQERISHQLETEVADGDTPQGRRSQHFLPDTGSGFLLWPAVARRRRNQDTKSCRCRRQQNRWAEKPTLPADPRCQWTRSKPGCQDSS